MRGRRAKTTVQREREGNPSKRPMNKTEAATGDGLPEPVRMGKVDAAMYRQVRKMLKEMHLEDKADRYAVELLARAYGTYRTNQDFIDSKGSAYQVKTGTGAGAWRAYPQARIAADAWRRVKSMLEEIGLTPSSRVKFGSQQETNELDSLIKKMAEN